MKLKELVLETSQEELTKKFNITKFEGCGMGLDEDKNIWYGWSHRAICGFKIGDKIFDRDYGDDSTKYSEHGKKTIKTLSDAKTAAKNFADYVS